MTAAHVDLSKQFGKCLERVYFPNYDSYLMAFDQKKMGVVDQDRFVLVWKPRKDIDSLPKHHVEGSGNDWPSLRLKFMNACINFDSTAHPYIEKVIDADVQRQDAYDWEDVFIKPWEKDIGLVEARQIIRRIAYDHNIDPLPKVSKGKGEVDENGKVYSEYVDGDIHLAHLTLMHAIHESAHMVVANQEEGDALYASHGPHFIWTLISLYNHYAKVPLDYMVATAGDHNLLGDTSYRKMNGRFSLVRHP